MTRGLALAFFAVFACAACTALNPPEQRLPERNACDGGSCEPDPCAKCDAPASCTSGHCRCPAGYLDPLGDGSRCEPRPAPEPEPACRSEADCGSHELCETHGGEAACRCAPGYERQDDSCAEVDECAQPGVCGENERCVDGDGTHECICEQGYSHEGKTCTDDDECDDEPCGAHAICENLPGSYGCSCEPGYAGDARDGCSDRHECANGELVCPEHASCQPRPGPDGCVCHPYYSDALGDGTECRDDRIEWSAWSATAIQLSVAPAAASGGSEGDELVALVFDNPGTLSLCDELFTASQGSRSLVLAVLAADGGCRWTRQLDTSGLGITGLTVDSDGSVALTAVTSPGATIDGQPLGPPPDSREFVLRFAPGGALVWALPVPCRATLYDVWDTTYWAAGTLASGEAGDVYMLVRYDGECTIGGLALPPASKDNVAIIKLARADGAAQWARTVVHEAGSTVMFNDLAVAADGNVYIAGQLGGTGVASFGPGARFVGGGFVFALDRDGATRWLRAMINPQKLTAGTPDRVRLMTFELSDEQTTFNLVELDAADGQERWAKRLVSGGHFYVELGSDAAGRTIFSTSVKDTGTIGGDPLLPTPGGLWSALIALDAAGKVTWSHAVLPQAFALSHVALTPSGKLFVTGYCSEACDLGGGVSSDTTGHFALRMRL